MTILWAHFCVKGIGQIKCGKFFAPLSNVDDFQSVQLREPKAARQVRKLVLRRMTDGRKRKLYIYTETMMLEISNDYIISLIGCC